MGDREQLLQRVGKKAHEYDKYSGCSQGVLLALQEEFGIGNVDSFKCATAFGGGVARHGETCGALVGALMALGLVVGRQRMQDTEVYRAAMQPAGELFRDFQAGLERELKFKKALSGATCREIQQLFYGRSFDLSDQKQYQAFLDAGGHSDEGCPRVCGIAARVAAGKILAILGR